MAENTGEAAKAAVTAAPAAVSEAQLRQAEAFVEAEEGVVNRLSGWAGSLVTSVATCPAPPDDG